MIRDGFVLPVVSCLDSLLRGEEMSPLFMDTGYKPHSPGSLSAEESHSNTTGSEREGDGQQTKGRGTKRKEKNRDAARKSRRKQTERADELHEELQGLERSNSALQKEIASLKKDFHLYTMALERHKPSCCLRDTVSSSSSTTGLSVTSSVDCQTGSSPPPPQASTYTQAAAVPSLSASLTSSLGLPTPDCVESIHLSSSAPAPTITTLASPSPSTVPYCVSLSTVPSPHSLFSNDPPLITSRPTNVTENAGLFAQGCPMNVPQLHPGQPRGNPLLLSSLQDPAPQSLSVTPQANSELSLASSSASKPSDSLHAAHHPESLLSLLTIPSPLNVSQTTSGTFDGAFRQPLNSLPPLGDTSTDLSLSELLEFNDWILQ
uniref:basic leucine zipper transcriptional factor ATF-like 2 n=1 Tax=Scatophagus argus TaxID=75038 RepID=UPI001ED7DD99|nr:basic leucine zipper transcriptional factor ATF-like 2 [Scatophagus argus]